MPEPPDIPRGLGRKTKLKGTGVTEGIDDVGHKLVVEDNWKNQAHAHALLERPWVGRTSFVVDPKQDISLRGDCRRQRARVSETPAQHTTACKISSRVSWVDLTEDREAPGKRR